VVRESLIGSRVSERSPHFFLRLPTPDTFVINITEIVCSVREIVCNVLEIGL